MSLLPLLAGREFVEVGSPADPDRRGHVVELGPLFIRAGKPDDGRGGPSPFLTFADLREATSSGEYLRRRKISLIRLGDAGGQAASTLIRAPTLLIGDTAPEDLGIALSGLSWYEADLLAQLAGGRLPEQKEADYVLARHAARLGALNDVLAIWTSSPYLRLAYSYRRFDSERRCWIVDGQIHSPVADDNAGTSGAPFFCVLDFWQRTRRVARHRHPAHDRSLGSPPHTVPIHTLIVFGDTGDG